MSAWRVARIVGDSRDCIPAATLLRCHQVPSHTPIMRKRISCFVLMVAALLACPQNRRATGLCGVARIVLPRLRV